MTVSDDIDLNPSELGNFYSKYFTYYGTLDESCQKIFIKRSLQFISEKKFTSAAEFVIDNRVKAIIAASAVQLTLGLKTWNLNHFDEIELHASDFVVPAGTTKYSGLTHLKGSIHLSWKSFIHGYTITDDNRNLGLHEFSHALRFNSITGNDQDYFITHYFNKWLSYAYEAFYDIKNKRETIFREYGGTNINEFLSVCIEHYFESPHEIKEMYPLLYYATGALLNQQTTNGITKIGVRDDFLQYQNKLLPGFNPCTVQGAFSKHWSFRLIIFVVAIAVYSILNTQTISVLSLILLSFTCFIFIWYEYSAVTIQFNGKEICFEKGAGIFKKRKIVTSSVSHLISVGVYEKEHIFTYYNHSDGYFHEEKTFAAEGLAKIFFDDCRRNKIAVLYRPDMIEANRSGKNVQE